MNDHAEWVALVDVMTAAERGHAPLGPEFAGYVVLEAAQRIRDVGGGLISEHELAIDATGQVHLVAPPRRADELRSTTGLRALLRSLLEVATSSTPALRHCARRREATPLAALLRELEGALIPLNRSASRRGVARVAKATFDAGLEGRLTRDDAEPAQNESPSPPPAPRKSSVETVIAIEAAAAKAPSLPPPKVCLDPLDAAPIPLVAGARTPTPPPSDDATPCEAKAGWIEPVGDAPLALADVDVFPRDGGDDGEGEGDDEPIEIVSHLPPLAVEGPVADLRTSTLPGIGLHGAALTALVAPDAPDTHDGARDDDSPRAFAVSIGPRQDVSREERKDGRDRVDALLSQFHVSRLRDDPALSRDLKAMIGVETSMPPAVAKVSKKPTVIVDGPHSTVETQIESSRSVDVAIDDGLGAELDETRPSGRRKRLGLLGWLSLVAIASIAATSSTKGAREKIGALFAISAPPGDGKLPSTTKPTFETPKPARLPEVCEASLTIDGVEKGTEVLRRLGPAPLTVAVPMHTPLDVVAMLDGMASRRVHLEASAAWSEDPTGPRLDLPIVLDTGDGRSFPMRSGGTASIEGAVARGLLRIGSNPSGATLWLSNTPPNVGAIPCGSPVELLVVSPSMPPRPVRVEWNTFTGSPPHAVTKL